jgi:hypothetical protein
MRRQLREKPVRGARVQCGAALPPVRAQHARTVCVRVVVVRHRHGRRRLCAARRSAHAHALPLCVRSVAWRGAAQRARRARRELRRGLHRAAPHAALCARHGC